jgi:nitrogen regulatory protein PII
MQSVKRIEIITDSLEMREVCRVLDRLAVSGYSIVRDVTGRGERGVQSGDELSDVFKNSLLLTACPPERLDEIVNAIRPILQRRGGVCLVSDALWVMH